MFMAMGCFPFSVASEGLGWDPLLKHVTVLIAEGCWLGERPNS